MNKKIVAAFDFDGTITYTDSLIFFFTFVVGPIRTFFYLFLSIPLFFAFFTGKIGRTGIKEALLRRFFKGRSIEEIRGLGERFVLEKLPKLISPEAIKRIEWHTKKGHRLVLVSASLDIYLAPWAKSMGFQDCLTSVLEIDKSGKITGKLKGKNCRGEEKVRRLLKLLGKREYYRIYAYGDSVGDKEMLEFADFAFYRKMG